ncbi:MAG: SDR family oxidoreductase [Acidimicrobiales bacterium]|nr:SDR family oxidoreductase [Acidimicrobiales bacterium]
MTVAIVTGGGRGIGAATCVALAGAGFDVCVNFHTDASAAARVVAQCETHGHRAIAAQGDVAAEDDVLALFDAADALGPLGVLVNNAGIVDIASPVADMSADRIQRMMAVNVLGPFVAAREAVRRMAVSRGGHGGVIVNVSSTGARIGSPNTYVDYAASKAAIETMTVGLAKEVAADGIRVNAIRPGIFDTDIHASGGQPDRAQQMAATIPMGRVGRPEEAASAIAWLCSEEASYVTGAILDVGGGR